MRSWGNKSDYIITLRKGGVNMENNVKILSKTMEDGGFTIIKQVTERLSEQDLLSRRQQ